MSDQKRNRCPNRPEYACIGKEVASRAVFDFNAAPTELSEFLPPRGYYISSLSQDDCQLICLLAERGKESLKKPTRLAPLQQESILHELSLIALREIRMPGLRGKPIAQAKVDQALSLYATNMRESPKLEVIGRTLNLSSTHLRRLFHITTGKGPKAAFNKVRMERIEVLLTQSNLSLEDISEETGFSDASALSRAVKKHFGLSPRHHRDLRMRQRQRGY